MKARTGQVALYLVLTIVAVCILAVMNVGAFLAIRAKNHAMNAGDAAALAVAKYQGELLNGIGAMNVEHLKAALANDESACADIMERQCRSCFLDPLRGLSIGSSAAAENGVDSLDDAEAEELRRLLIAHVSDIRNYFANDGASYPEPWPGAWMEYAAELELQIAACATAWPENAEFADVRESFPLGCQSFYQAIAGRAWCWFKFNGLWLFDRDSGNLPQPDFSRPGNRFNSEIYPLHLRFDSLPEVLDEEWTNIIKKVADCTEQDIAASYLLTNASQRWAFYDSRWDAWSTYPGIAFNPTEFPVVGEVRREYDVLGCAAICRVMGSVPDLVGRDDATYAFSWTAAAKPFGTVENLEGDADVVTALRRLVVPAFEAVRLVPVDSVGGRDLHTADPAWLNHEKHHLAASPYFTPAGKGGCWYCAQLMLWDQPSFRQQGADWLRFNGSGCSRPQGSGTYRGGTMHGH